jgi:hypothetical protein
MFLRIRLVMWWTVQSGLKTWRCLVPLLATLVLANAGCRSWHPPPPPPPHYRLESVLDLSAPPGDYPDLRRETIQALNDQFPCESRPEHELQPRWLSPPSTPTAQARCNPPLNILALSGGGQFGTFAAGILVGWSEAGTRPTFDVCTGVSSGALTAAFAFIGPKYDAALRRLSLCLDGSDLFRVQPVRQLVKNQAIASSSPLARMIEQEFDSEYMAELRAAHAQGRRLFVATMNLESRRMVVWDLGAIASSGRPDADCLVRRILLATSSISGFVPAVEIPVEVNGVRCLEKHVDAGAVTQVFLRLGEHHPRYGSAGPGKPWLCNSNLYLIAGGKLWTDPNMERQGAIARAAGTVSATLYALYRANLIDLYATCVASGMKFHLMAIPPEVNITAGSVAFDQNLMRRLFTLGYHYGFNGVPWRHLPPGGIAGEEEKPRAGFAFQVP